MLESKAETSASSARQQEAIQYVLDQLRRSLASLPGESAVELADQIRMTLDSPSAGLVDTGKAELLQTLGGREYSDEERLTLEALALLERFRERRELLQHALTTPQVAELMGTTRQAPYERAKNGSLLAVSDRGALRFPSWQFDPESDDGVVTGLTEVIRTLRMSPLAKVGWLQRRNAYLDDMTPLEGLRAGRTESVAGLARAAGRT